VSDKKHGAGLFLETMAEGGRPALRFLADWNRLRASLQSDIARLRAHSTANLSEERCRELYVCAEDAQDSLDRAVTLVPFIQSELDSIEDAFGNAIDAEGRVEQEAQAGQEPKRS